MRWAWAAVLALVLCGAPGLAETTPAIARVETLHAALLGVLKDSATVGYDERFARLAPVVEQTFDLAFMAEKCVGRSWRTLDAEDRVRWIATFTRFTTANYAGRFTGFAGQSFETLGEEPGANDTTLVRTRLVNPSEENVDLTYRLRKVGEGWRVIDVYLDGTVSELALRRTEYASVLKRDGFDTLIALVDGKIAKLAATEAESATKDTPASTGDGT